VCVCGGRNVKRTHIRVRSWTLWFLSSWGQRWRESAWSRWLINRCRAVTRLHWSIRAPDRMVRILCVVVQYAMSIDRFARHIDKWFSNNSILNTTRIRSELICNKIYKHNLFRLFYLSNPMTTVVIILAFSF